MTGNYTGNLIDYILKRNQEQSEAFCGSSARLARTIYRAQFPTEFAALKCMDGRLNLALFTETPTGIIQPFRNIGGKFDLGWPFFAESIKAWVNYCAERGRNTVFLVTYHFSRGKKERGCAGWNYDTDSARASAFSLARQVEEVFGASPRIVYPIVIGLETDNESLVLHGSADQVIDLSTLKTTDGLEDLIRGLYPDMPSHIVRDFFQLLKGNINHIEEVRRSDRPPIDLEHREQIIAVGRGFDWLHIPNKALIIGPYSHEWPDAVATAGKIILGNLASGRIPHQEGVLLLVAAMSRDQEGSFGWNLAKEKAQYLESVCQKVLNDRVPELKQCLKVLSGVTFADTRKFHVLSNNQSEKAHHCY